MNRRTSILLFAVLLIIIAGIALYFLYFSGKPAQTGQTATTSPFTTSGSTTTGTGEAAPATHVSDSSQYYSIDLQYPSQTPLATAGNAAADAQVVATLKSYAETSRDSFISEGDFSDMTPEAFQDEGGRAESFTDDYQLYTGAHTFTYVFTLVSDTNGAHPNSTYKTFTFDTQSGQQIQLADLFTPGSSYLQQLSQLSKQSLTAQLGDEASFVDDGTKPTADNFASFALDGSNLDIFFPPYQVAAYAAGPQTVKIPLSQLSSILQPQYK